MLRITGAPHRLRLEIGEAAMTDTHRERRHRRGGGIVGGIILILIGFYAFAGQFITTPWAGGLLLGTLALVFIAWGILGQIAGLLVPGGILGGIAVGLLLMQSPTLQLTDQRQAGIFILSLAGGFAAVGVLTYFVFHQLRIWSCIAAAVLAVVGLILWIGGPLLNLLEMAAMLWPLILILIGGVIVWQALRRERQT